MSVEQKIQELLNRGSEKQLNEEQGYEKTMPMQGSSQKASSETINTTGGKPTVNVGKDNSKAGKNSGTGNGDASMPMQGGSQKSSFDDLGDPTNDQIKVTTGKDNSKSGKGSGQGDTSMPKQGSSAVASYKGYVRCASCGMRYLRKKLTTPRKPRSCLIVFGYGMSLTP